MLTDVIQYYEMVLVPMEDARQRAFTGHFLHRRLHPEGAEAHRLYRIGKSQHRYALSRSEAVLP